MVVLAFVGATVALRPTSSSSPQPDTPGLPAPTEAVQSPTGSTAPASSSAPALSPARSTGAAPSRTTRSTADAERDGHRVPDHTGTDHQGGHTGAADHPAADHPAAVRDRVAVTVAVGHYYAAPRTAAAGGGQSPVRVTRGAEARHRNSFVASVRLRPRRRGMRCGEED